MARKRIDVFILVVVLGEDEADEVVRRVCLILWHQEEDLGNCLNKSNDVGVGGLA